MLVPMTSGCSTQPVPEVDPTSAQALEQAVAALHAGDYSRSIALVNAVDSHRPGLVESNYVRGQIYFDLQMYSESRVFWERARQAEPDYWLWSHNLGDVAFRQGRYADAADHYRAAAELDPNPLSLHGLASAYLELGRADSSRSILEQAMSIDSAYAPAYLSLSTLAEEEGRFERALELAERALELDSTSVAAFRAVGILHVRLGQFEQARGYLGRALERDPYDHSALHNYGTALQRTGRAAEAREILDAAEAIRVQDRSLQLLRDAVTNNPSNPANQLALAEALHQSGRLADALRAYKAVDLLAPGNTSLRHTIATLHLELGEPEVAASRYRRLLAEDSTFVEVWLNLGLAYARMDSLPEAQRVWRRAGERFPDDPRVQQVLARIRP